MHSVLRREESTIATHKNLQSLQQEAFRSIFGYYAFKYINTTKLLLKTVRIMTIFSKTNIGTFSKFAEPKDLNLVRPFLSFLSFMFALGKRSETFQFS